MQLFLLLQLNCGFTNVDVGTLVKSEIRLKDGRIVRQRTKTRRHPNPPVVNYKLWSRTAQLLRTTFEQRPCLGFNESGRRTTMREQIGCKERRNPRNCLVFVRSSLWEHERAETANARQANDVSPQNRLIQDMWRNSIPRS